MGISVPGEAKGLPGWLRGRGRGRLLCLARGSKAVGVCLLACAVGPPLFKPPSLLPPPQALSQRDAPLNNFFFFNGMKGSGMVESLAPTTESGL